MTFRKATFEDLPALKQVYTDIIEDMNKKGIKIWDDVYPCEIFYDDIKNDFLYVLTQGEEILSAVALCKGDEGESSMKWEKEGASALYLSRLGVNVNYLQKGIGQLTLQKSAETAKKLGAEYLRLFVVNKNLPAINLYLKCGYKKVEGIFTKTIDGDFVLNEYGYEKCV